MVYSWCFHCLIVCCSQQWIWLILLLSKYALMLALGRGVEGRDMALQVPPSIYGWCFQSLWRSGIYSFECLTVKVINEVSGALEYLRVLLAPVCFKGKWVWKLVVISVRSAERYLQNVVFLPLRSGLWRQPNLDLNRMLVDRVVRLEFCIYKPPQKREAPLVLLSSVVTTCKCTVLRIELRLQESFSSRYTVT